MTLLRKNWAVVVIVVVAFTIRVAFAYLFRHQYLGDAMQNIRIAFNLAGGHGFSHSYHAPFEADGTRSPLFPLLLVPIILIPGPRALYSTLANSALDALTVACIYALASRWFNPRVGTTAAILYALCPMAIGISSQMLAGSLATLMLTSWLLALAYGRTWLGGVLAGLVGLSAASLLPIVAGGYLVRMRSGLAAASTGLALAIAIMLPWCVRNQLAAGRFTPAPPSAVGGSAWYGVARDASPPIGDSGEAWDRYAVWVRQWRAEDVDLPTAVRMDEMLLTDALDAALGQPGRYAAHVARRAAWMWWSDESVFQDVAWTPTTFAAYEALDPVVAAFQRIVLILALIGAARTWRSPPTRACVAMMLGVTFVCAPIHVEPRYALPLSPEVCMLAAVAVQRRGTVPSGAGHHAPAR